jgi:hypothetical protein
MHIRIRNKVAQLIRTTYDPTRKKPRNTIVGRVPLANPTLDAETRQVLTEDEINEFESWALQQQRALLLQEELDALTLADRMARASRWLAREGDTAQTRAIGAGILANLQILRRSLKKIGLAD